MDPVIRYTQHDNPQTRLKFHLIENKVVPDDDDETEDTYTFLGSDTRVSVSPRPTQALPCYPSRLRATPDDLRDPRVWVELKERVKLAHGPECFSFHGFASARQIFLELDKHAFGELGEPEFRDPLKKHTVETYCAGADTEDTEASTLDNEITKKKWQFALAAFFELLPHTSKPASLDTIERFSKEAPGDVPLIVAVGLAYLGIWTTTTDHTLAERSFVLARGIFETSTKYRHLALRVNVHLAYLFKEISDASKKRVEDWKKGLPDAVEIDEQAEKRIQDEAAEKEITPLVLVLDKWNLDDDALQTLIERIILLAPDHEIIAQLLRPKITDSHLSHISIPDDATGRVEEKVYRFVAQGYAKAKLQHPNEIAARIGLLEYCKPNRAIAVEHTIRLYYLDPSSQWIEKLDVQNKVEYIKTLVVELAETGHCNTAYDVIFKIAQGSVDPSVMALLLEQAQKIENTEKIIDAHRRKIACEQTASTLPGDRFQIVTSSIWAFLDFCKRDPLEESAYQLLADIQPPQDDPSEVAGIYLEMARLLGTYGEGAPALAHLESFITLITPSLSEGGKVSKSVMDPYIQAHQNRYALYKKLGKVSVGDQLLFDALPYFSSIKYPDQRRAMLEFVIAEQAYSFVSAGATCISDGGGESHSTSESETGSTMSDIDVDTAGTTEFSKGRVANEIVIRVMLLELLVGVYEASAIEEIQRLYELQSDCTWLATLRDGAKNTHIYNLANTIKTTNPLIAYALLYQLVRECKQRDSMTLLLRCAKSLNDVEKTIAAHRLIIEMELSRDHSPRKFADSAKAMIAFVGYCQEDKPTHDLGYALLTSLIPLEPNRTQVNAAFNIRFDAAEYLFANSKHEQALAQYNHAIEFFTPYITGDNSEIEPTVLGIIIPQYIHTLKQRYKINATQGAAEEGACAFRESFEVFNPTQYLDERIQMLQFAQKEKFVTQELVTGELVAMQLGIQHLKKEELPTLNQQVFEQLCAHITNYTTLQHTVTEALSNLRQYWNR